MQKLIKIDEIDQGVIISHRKGTKSVRISIRSDGIVRLTVPYGVSEQKALSFLRSKADWINDKLPKTELLQHGIRIGKSHTLIYASSQSERPRGQIKNQEIQVSIPENSSWHSDSVQKSALKTCERALQAEAENLLPQRLEHLSKKHDLPYHSVVVKKLRSRWGACDNRKKIQLNIYLLQLDWQLIDYVILHELTHTIHQHHQSGFWEMLLSLEPNAKVLRAELKSKRTAIHSTVL